MENTTTYDVYEVLSASQMARIIDSNIIQTINGKPCRKVSTGITESMKAWYPSDRKHIVIAR